MELAEISGEEPGQVSIVPPPGEMEPGNGVHITTEYCEPGIFVETYLELGNAMKEGYMGLETASRGSRVI